MGIGVRRYELLAKIFDAVNIIGMMMLRHNTQPTLDNILLPVSQRIQENIAAHISAIVSLSSILVIIAY